MTIREQMNRFSEEFAKKAIVGNTTWRYYRLGAGAPILWLPGAVRRAALGFAFMERLATRHTVIAPDYPAVQTIDGLFAGLDVILRAEGVDTFVLGGQSYGASLAQAYLAHRGQVVERLILSSGGPANGGKGWVPALYCITLLVRLLPQATVKNLLAGGVIKGISVPAAERTEWEQVIRALMQNDLSRADVVAHFAATADMIRKGIVAPAAYRGWTGRILVLRSEDDPTQGKTDIPRYESLFGRAVEVLSMGDLSHTAYLVNPDKFVELLEQALA
jgi:pimeloyl-ACP methyl ester carboxylesterase